MNDREARLVLSRLVEPGVWSVFDAVQQHGAVAVATALRRGTALPGLSTRLIKAAAGRATGWDPAAEQGRIDAVGARLVVPGDEEWPDGLVWPALVDSPEMSAPPLSLFLRGPCDLARTCSRAVAVVGARACSSYGNHVARELGHRLAERGCAVVSGGAYGIDAEAHRGALLAEEGATVAVLASGVDVAYPRGNARLLDAVAQRGLLVSEVLPGTQPTRGRFLVRNRLIAALAQGTVVVEAALRSGSLSTASRANDLSRKVMAVPGPITSTLSEGCHLLVRERGAALVTSHVDVLAQLHGAPPERERGEARVRDDLSEIARQVLDLLPVRGGTGEATLARALGVPVIKVQQLLPPLQIHGLIQRGDAGWVLTPLATGKPGRS